MNVHAVIAATAHTLSRHGLQVDVSAPAAGVARLEVNFGLEHHVLELVDDIEGVTASQGRRAPAAVEVDWLEPRAILAGPEDAAELVGGWVATLTFTTSLDADLDRAIESATD